MAPSSSASGPTISLSSLPSNPTVVFQESSFFSRNNGQSLPTLSEVLVKSVAQNFTHRQKATPPPVFFESLGLAVKFGREETGFVSISEGQCLWALRRVLPEVPVPEIYGWSTEDGYVLLYMEMVKGVTVEERWPSMTDNEKMGFWGALRSLVSSLQTLSQDPDDQFFGRINRSPYCDISITNSNRPPAGPFTTVNGFHDWISLVLRRAVKSHWPGMKPEEIPDPYREMLPDDAQVPL